MNLMKEVKWDRDEIRKGHKKGKRREAVSTAHRQLPLSGTFKDLLAPLWVDGSSSMTRSRMLQDAENGSGWKMTVDVRMHSRCLCNCLMKKGLQTCLASYWKCKRDVSEKLYGLSCMFHVHNIENVLKRDEATRLLCVSRDTYITCVSNLDVGEW
ncbi:hypothetical protein LR48_Vigan03g107100 [Vigna angularis]|uniref:Uncharacterized protein n=1 Tax=Phaseolus angularis TaxID=3914 RepID=A0A0L9U5I9_PHAAN|nr:hypothetical protein LR48_Vigan03g107100 [Vigna angularis]